MLMEVLGLLVLPLLMKASVHLPQALPKCSGRFFIELQLCFVPGPAGLSSSHFQLRVNSVSFEALPNLQYCSFLLLPPPGKRTPRIDLICWSPHNQKICLQRLRIFNKSQEWSCCSLVSVICINAPIYQSARMSHVSRFGAKSHQRF